jgi:hypothetical protein
MLPLQIAGDLEGSRERSVLRHLATCEDCRRLADDFAERRSLLAEACRLPEFNSAFYSEIRNSVLDEIARQRTSTTSGFHRRWLWATAFAALLITFGVLLQHFSSAIRQRPGEIAGPPSPQVQIKQRPAGTLAPTPAPTKSSTEQMAVAGSHKRIEKSKAAVEKVRDGRAPVTETAASASVQGSTAVSAATSLTVATVSRPAPVSAAHVSRIEIQTGNPNIRIIWLTAQAPEPTERVDHAQDQDENGDLR